MKRLMMLSVVALAAAAAPASAQNREQRQMMADIRMLQEQTQQLAVAIATMTQTLQALLQDSIKARQYAPRRADRRHAQGLRRSEAPHRQHGQGRAGHPRAGRRHQRARVDVREEIEALRTLDPGRAAAGLRSRGACRSRTRRPCRCPRPRRRTPPSTAGLSPTRMFDTARADYAAGQWSLALTGFDAFLKTFPRSEKADDAQFSSARPITRRTAGRMRLPRTLR